MGKKESNEVRMLGILPSQGADPIPVGKIPDGGTQVVAWSHTENATLVVYTVSTGKTLYLSNATFISRNSAELYKYTRFFVTNAADEDQYYFYRIIQLADSIISCPYSFLPPLEIPAGYKIKLFSGDSDLQCMAFIHGYEV